MAEAGLPASSPPASGPGRALSRYFGLGLGLSLMLAFSACGGRPGTSEVPELPPKDHGVDEARDDDQGDNWGPQVSITPPADEPAKQDGSLPLRLAKTGHLLVPLQIGERSYEFILDTGASVNVITPQTREQLGMGPDEGVPVQAAGANGAIDNVRLVKLEGLRVAGRDYPQSEAAVMPLEHLERALGESLPGILGQSFLAAHHLDLDFAASLVTLHPITAAAPRIDGATEFAYQLFSIAPLIKLEVSINGSKPIDAVLDLGAGRSIINWRAAQLLGFRRDDATLKRAAQPLLGADNKALDLRVLKVAQLELGELQIHDKQLHIGDIGIFKSLGLADGPAMVFGVDMLAGRRIVIDYAHKQLQIGPMSSAN